MGASLPTIERPWAAKGSGVRLGEALGLGARVGVGCGARGKLHASAGTNQIHSSAHRIRRFIFFCFQACKNRSKH